MHTDNIKTVYLARHGQSVDNIGGIVQYDTSELSNIGWHQSEKLARRAKNLTFDHLISSPLTRTKQTADLISEATGKDINLSDLFVECIKPTSIHGKKFSDSSIKEAWLKWNDSLMGDGPAFEDGETYTQIIERADKALELLAEHSSQRILVVTHGFFIRTLVARIVLRDSLTPSTLKSFQHNLMINNTGLTALRYTDDLGASLSWRLWIYNDDSHLAEG